MIKHRFANRMNISRCIAVAVLAVLCLSGCGEKQTKETEIATEYNGSEESDMEESAANEYSESEETDIEKNNAAGAADTGESGADQRDSISLIMVGDILLHTPVEAASLQEDGSYNYTAIFANMTEEIQAADLALVNQEVIIGGEELGISGYPAFNAAFSAGEALVEAGFDVICHGTNHALDKGKRGLLNCIHFWRENYPEIAVLGIHDSQDSQDEIYIYEQDDMKIAILNFTYGTNGIPMPEGMPYAVDMLEEQKVVDVICRAEELADFTIVCPHWGTEYQLEQSANQERWAQLFAENGVDLVLGTHPHVIQPIEWVVDAATGHEMLVYYSLGNFVNWTSESGTGIANRMVGGMAQVTLERDQDDQVQIAEYGIEPVVCHLEQGINGVTVYRLDEYTNELADHNEIRKQDAAFSLEYCRQLCEQVWGVE